MKYLILENIRSAHNVGSIFRTADGAGVSKIYLLGYTPTPIDRFGRPQPEIQKTSLGASETIPWEQHATIADILPILAQEGVVVTVVEQTASSDLISSFVTPEKVAFVVGNEVEGVSPEALAAAAQIVELPMLGKKESLNVSVATGIVLYHDLVSKK